MKDDIEKDIERNQFSAQWLDDAEKVGFTKEQLNFLEKYYSSPQTLDELL